VITRGIWKRVAPFVTVLAIGAAAFLSAGFSFTDLFVGHSGDLPKASPQFIKCMEVLKSSSAMKNNSIRVAIHARSEEYPPKSPDTIIDVEVARFDPRAACNPRFAPSGALRLEAISMVLDNGPEYSGRNPDIGPKSRRFSAGIFKSAEHALSFWAERGIADGSWQPHGRRFGLDLYRLVLGLKNPKIRPVPLGANFIGRSPGGFFVKINCVDFDYTRDIACQLMEELKPDVMLSIVLPTDNIAQWADYSRVAEKYYLENVEH
jgi:hypothetical protein